MQKIFFFFAIIFSLTFSAQAVSAADNGDVESYPGSNSKCLNIADPFEKFNRTMFNVNSALDHFLLRPVSKGYRNVFHQSVRDKVSNAVANTREPLTFVNSGLQMKGGNALMSFWRFVVNSTLGIGGMEDVAAKQGMHIKPQTFGSTLARYGVGSGPYLVLPIFGSTNFRDMFDPIILDKNMNPLNYKINSVAENTIMGVKLVSDRARIMPFTDHITKTSPDPYAAIRSASHQNREKDLTYPTFYKCK
jgi:phospholipid-binding lipoprotein MlaA